MTIQLRKNEYVVSGYFANDRHYAMTSMGILWCRSSVNAGWVAVS